jgi:hypothetical protein
MQEVRMTNLMLRIVTLATCSIALSAAFSFAPVVAAGGDHRPQFQLERFSGNARS